MNKRKIYYSFHDLPSNREVRYDAIGPQGVMKFSQTELVQIFIALAVLTIAFSFALAPYPPLAHLLRVAENLPLSFLAIITAFFCHELAHKYLAQKYGYWSEFRMYPQGLLFALLLSIFVGLVFAAPGAVQIFGRPTREENGRMAAVGPATNLAIAMLFTPFWFFLGGYVGYIAFFIAYINTFLAFFNLLPFGPMDGLKILRWKKTTWVSLIGISIILFVILFISPLSG